MKGVSWFYSFVEYLQFYLLLYNNLTLYFLLIFFVNNPVLLSFCYLCNIVLIIRICQSVASVADMGYHSFQYFSSMI